MFNRHQGIARTGIIVLLLIAAAIVILFLLPTPKPGIPATAAATPVATATQANCLTPPADFNSPAVLASTAPTNLWKGWTYNKPIMLTATPSSASWDQPINIRVNGLKPSEPVTLHATAKDRHGITWSASATFKADAEGVVNVSRDAPLYGTYAGTHPMGFIWSMTPEGIKNKNSYPFSHASDPQRISLAVSADKRVLAHTNLFRMLKPANITQTKINANGLVGMLYRPSRPGLHSGLIVLGGSEGGYDSKEAELLATHGYITLALAYFGLPGLPKQLADIPLEYFARAANWFKQQRGVDSHHVGIIGWSFGAQAALIVAATYPQDYQAVVVVAPGSVINQGLNFGLGPPTSAWSLNGKPLPYVPFVYTAGMFYDGKMFLRSGYLKSMANSKAVAKAVIPVERIAAPILLVSGTDDQLWPSELSAHMIMSRLKAHHHAYADESLCYVGAGHFINAPYEPTLTTGAPDGGSLILVGGGNQLAYAYADRDSWQKVLMFLRTTLQ